MKLLAIALAAAMGAMAAGHAGASGFALIEQSGSGMGNAFAGGAAAAEDASTIFFNPAGLTRLTSPQVVLAVHAINIDEKFQNGNSQAALGQPLGGNGGQVGDLAWVPNLYLSMPVTPQIALGLGVNAPFGLKTEYESDWIGRFQAIKSDVKSINVQPTIAWKVSDAFSVGAGINWQKLDAEFTSAVNYTAVVAQGLQAAAAGGLIKPSDIPGLVAANAGLAGSTRITGDDSDWGWNVGVLWNLAPQSRVGFQYRSSIKYEIKGDVSFNAPVVPPGPANPGGLISAIIANVSNPGPPPGQLSNGPVHLHLETPNSASVSIFHQLSPQIDLMGDVSWTGWSNIPELRFVRSNGSELGVTPEQWRDTWRYSAGANWHMDQQWMFRGGLAFDQSPVPDSTRTPRLPDNDRTWLALGVQYRFSPQAKFDFGYAHLFVKDADINQNNGNQAAYGLINGKYNTSIDIFSLQLAYNF
jgi:long-chain fatty acid transport protein